MGSAGSVFQVFQDQIKKGNDVTITDLKMSRFVMSISEATKYIIEVSNLAVGGEVFVPKMPAINITTLADALIKINCSYKTPKKLIIGAKPGEKMYEELVGSEEIRRTIEIKNYYVILPAFSNLFPKITKKYNTQNSNNLNEIYNSQTSTKLSCEEVINFIHKHKII